jgi:hypothetical protein
MSPKVAALTFGGEHGNGQKAKPLFVPATAVTLSHLG